MEIASLGSAAQSALEGLKRAEEKTLQAAQNIAEGSLNPEDVVSLSLAALDFKANAAVLKNNNEQAALSVESVKESQNAYDIAKARFDAGAIDYLTLLDTQRSLYLQQDNQISVRQAQLQSFVQLHKALGA